MTIQRVFYVSLQRPWLPILELDAEIISGKKFTWAKLPNNKRALLGASAYFLRSSAVHRKRRALQQAAMVPRYIGGGYRQDKANAALRAFERTGEMD